MYIVKSRHYDTCLLIYKRIISHQHGQDDDDEANSLFNMNQLATLQHVLIADEDISVTLCMLSSVYHSFPRRAENHRQELVRSNDVVIVDELSESADCDWFPLSSLIGYNNRPYPDRWPRIVTIRDPLQLELPLRSNRPSPYTSVKKLSFSEIISPCASPLLRGSNIVPMVKLNVQYRTANIVNDVSNEVEKLQAHTPVYHRRV